MSLLSEADIFLRIDPVSGRARWQFRGKGQESCYRGIDGVLRPPIARKIRVARFDIPPASDLCDSMEAYPRAKI